MRKFICPVCGCRTLLNRGENDICQVCYWQDDGEYDENIPNECNSGVTIKQARANFLKYGAYDKQFKKSTRKPDRYEITDIYMKLINNNGGI